MRNERLFRKSIARPPSTSTESGQYFLPWKSLSVEIYDASSVCLSGMNFTTVAPLANKSFKALPAPRDRYSQATRCRPQEGAHDWNHEVSRTAWPTSTLLHNMV